MLAHVINSVGVIWLTTFGMCVCVSAFVENLLSYSGNDILKLMSDTHMYVCMSVCIMSKQVLTLVLEGCSLISECEY